jgi:predicted GNAT family acetyltransferase
MRGRDTRPDMSATTDPTPVIHRPEQHRFEAVVDGQRCVADYQMIDGVMWMTHTEVPPALNGRGLAARLVAAALAHARAQGLKVRPACSYVRAYMQRHRETQDLLDTGG